MYGISGITDSARDLWRYWVPPNALGVGGAIRALTWAGTPSGRVVGRFDNTDSPRDGSSGTDRACSRNDTVSAPICISLPLVGCAFTSCAQHCIAPVYAASTASEVKRPLHHAATVCQRCVAEPCRSRLVQDGHEATGDSNDLQRILSGQLDCVCGNFRSEFEGLFTIQGVVGAWSRRSRAEIWRCSGELRNPSAEPRRCSRRPLMASVGPLLVPGLSK